MAAYDPKNVEITFGGKRVERFASGQYVHVGDALIHRSSIPLTYRRVIESGLLGLPLSRDERRDLLEWMYLLGKSPDDVIGTMEQHEWAVTMLVLFLRWGYLP